jgi:hypothetical protein
VPHALAAAITDYLAIASAKKPAARAAGASPEARRVMRARVARGVAACTRFDARFVDSAGALS